MLRKGYKTLKYQKLQPDQHISLLSTAWLINGCFPKPPASIWRWLWTRY